MLNKLQELKNTRKSGESGFTIIEVMIVLAIAGLILLIVLLAIPALQRNSRNTAIKNDVSAVSAAISEFKSNNDGALPDNAVVAGTSGKLTISGPAATTTEAEGRVQAGTDVTLAGAAPTEPGKITVNYKKKCQSSTSATLDNSVRSTAILYNIETTTASGVAIRCIDA